MVAKSYDPPPMTYSNACHLCEVLVDVDTGAITIVRYLVVENCGTVINPTIVEGQQHGATVMGLSGTLLEHVVYDDQGQNLTGSLADYLIATADQAPEIQILEPRGGTVFSFRELDRRDGDPVVVRWETRNLAPSCRLSILAPTPERQEPGVMNLRAGNSARWGRGWPMAGVNDLVQPGEQTPDQPLISPWVTLRIVCQECPDIQCESAAFTITE